MPQEKIFLSAVTGQFKECRDALRSDLAAVGAVVVVQEDFQQHGGTLLEKLEAYIASCDRVIALVGSAYGWGPEPAAPPEKAPARSYTQWEYYFARGERLDGTKAAPKPVYVYFAAPSYLERYPVQQSDAEAQRQQAFIDAIKASNKDRNKFDSINNLARLVLRDGFRLPSASLFNACQAQTRAVLADMRHKYDPSLYVHRAIEDELGRFIDGPLEHPDRNCFLIVAPAGSGKTNLLCALAGGRMDAQPVLLLMGGNTYLSGTTGLLAEIKEELQAA